MIFYKEFKSKKSILGGNGTGGEGGGGWGLAVGVDEQTDEQIQTNLPLQVLRSWGIIMCKLCP